MKRCAGQTLILVLWIMGILTVAMGTLVARSVHTLRLGSFPMQKIQRQAVAQAAVWQSVGLLKQDDPGIDHLQETWATGIDAATRVQLLKDIMVGEGAFSVGVKNKDGSFQAGMIDEQGKLNINTASAEQIARLIEQLAPDAPVADLAAAILDWRDEPAGEPCQAAVLACHNGAFDSLDELRLVPGMTAAIFDAVASQMTVYGPGEINANTASAQVLNAIGGEGDAWVEQRRTEPFAVSPDTNIPNLGVTSAYFTVAVHAKLAQGSTETQLQAVIDRDGRIYR